MQWCFTQSDVTSQDVNVSTPTAVYSTSIPSTASTVRTHAPHSSRLLHITACPTTDYLHTITDLVSTGGNAVASVRLFVFTPTCEPSDLDLCMCVGQDHSPHGIEDQSRRSRLGLRLVLWPQFETRWVSTPSVTRGQLHGCYTKCNTVVSRQKSWYNYCTRIACNNCTWNHVLRDGW